MLTQILLRPPLAIVITVILLFLGVLAIGVVDDAIVVVEAVQAKMHARHLSPYRATMEVLHEVSGTVIAITLVMTAVFVPVTFVPGPVGTFYRQFGITRGDVHRPVWGGDRGRACGPTTPAVAPPGPAPAAGGPQAAPPEPLPKLGKLP